MRNIKVNLFVTFFVITLTLGCFYVVFQSIASNIYQDISNSTKEAYEHGFKIGSEVQKIINDIHKKNKQQRINDAITKDEQQQLEENIRKYEKSRIIFQ